MVGLFISKTLYKKTRLKRTAFGVVCGVYSDVSMCALACGLQNYTHIYARAMHVNTHTQKKNQNRYTKLSSSNS